MTITKKQFLARALLWKQKYKDAPNYKDPDFEGGKSYEYEGDDKYAIFNWARREFPYYNRFSDNKELTKRFFDDYQRADQQLLKDINQEATATEDQIVSSQPAEAVPVGVVSSGESASTMAGGMGGFGLPSGGSTISPGPRRIVHIVPPTSPEPESSKIVIANKSGVVAEKAPSTLYVANKSGVVVEERTITPTSSITKKPESPSKLYITDKGGRVLEERNITPSSTTIKKPEAPPKILVADKSGKIIEKSPVVSRELYIANKSGVEVGKYTVPKASRFNFPSRFKFPTGLVNSLKNFGSRLGVFFKRNFGKFLTMGRVATVASAGIGAFAGASFGGAGMFAGGIGGAILPSWVKSGGAGRFFSRAGNGVINFGARLSNQVGKGGLKLAGPKKKVVLLFLGGFLLFGLAAGLLGALNPGGAPTGAPTAFISTSDISQCKFTRGGTSAPIKSRVLQSWITETAAKENIPIAIMASVTMHENPDFVSNADDQHDAIKNNYYYRVSKVNEGSNKNTNAIGLFQISVGQTPTSEGIVDHCEALFGSGIITKAADKLGKKVREKSYYCVLDFDERVKRFCQTDRVERNRTYGIPDKPYDESYINLCNLQDNILTGAVFLNTTIRGKSWDDAANLRSAISGFYGACVYPGGDYCTEVAADYQSCKPTFIGGTSGDLAGVVQWAERISKELQAGNPPSSYNKMVANITNGTYTATTRTAIYREGARSVSPDGIYWCTNIVVDSYNLAGIKGLNANHQGVRGMKTFWESTPNYQFIRYTGSDSLKQVKPGFALFRVCQGLCGGIVQDNYERDHVSIVHAINPPDDKGNGSIKTLDSNSAKEWSTTIREGKIIETFFAAPIVGFGGHAGGASTFQATSLEEVFNNLPGNHSAMAILPDGQRIQKNADKAIPAYSAIKLWIAATILEAASKGELNLSEEYTIQAGDIASGTGNINSSNVGKSYTYQQLMEFMLIYSDNSSANILLKKLGPGQFGFTAVNSYAQRNNFPATKIQRFLGSLDPTNDNFTSAADGVTFMERLYKKQIVNSEASDNLTSILNRRRELENKSYIYIGRSLPVGVEFIEKSGVGPKTRGDIGSFVAKNGQRVYLAILLSNLTNETVGETAIAKSALDIYNLTR